MEKNDSKTTPEYWEGIYSARPRLRLPSSLIASTADLKNLLRTYVHPHMHVLEIGFAPGKLLAFVAKVLQAKVTGLDYSENGVHLAKRLFEALRIDGDLHCEDVFSTTLPRASFDFVYSVGLIEHFDDPRDIVRLHVELARPGGTVLIAIPNYGGVYGRLQRYFDPANLAIHNLNIMNCGAMVNLAPQELVEQTTARRVGKINPWLISLDRKLPGWVAKPALIIGNCLALVQPFDIGPLCPMIALTMVRRDISP